MRQIRLLEDPVRRVFFSYLIPSISATLVTSIYILADTMMIGRGIGAIGIAALNILLPLYSAYFGIGMMCGVGGSVLFNFSRGRGEERRARQYFTASVGMVIFLAVVSVLVGQIFFRQILNFLGNTESMEAYSVPYGKILMNAAPMFMLSTFLQAFVRNDGSPRLAMAGVISGGVTNMILDYVFIYILGWGMRGAIMATVTGTTLTVLILCSHFFSAENHLKPEWSITARKIGEILTNGLASFILEISGGLVTLLFNRQLLAYVGDIGIVVYGIISNTALVATSISNGMSQAVQPLLSANFGAEKWERVQEGRRLGAAAALLTGVLFAACGFFLPVQLSYLFLEPSGEVLAMAVPAIRLYFAGFLVSGWNIMCGTYFQSVVKPRHSLVITLLRGVLLNSVLVFLLPAVMGVNGIWLTVTVSEFLTAAAAFWLIRKGTPRSGMETKSD